MAGEKRIVFEKPVSLHRIFFSVLALAPVDPYYVSKISFDDPHFFSYYMLGGYSEYFESKGVDIFQGNVWVQNTSSADLRYSLSEILH